LEIYTAGLEIDIRIILKLARPMPQAVGRRPLAAEAGDRSLASIREICCGQSGTGTGFSPSTSSFPSVGSGEGSTFIQSFIHLSPIAYNFST
jgi:hypothetical protein